MIDVADREPDSQLPGAARQRGGERDRIRPSRAGGEHRRAAWQQIGGGEQRELHWIARHLSDSTGDRSKGGARGPRERALARMAAPVVGPCGTTARRNRARYASIRRIFRGLSVVCPCAARVSNPTSARERA